MSHLSAASSHLLFSSWPLLLLSCVPHSQCPAWLPMRLNNSGLLTLAGVKACWAHLPLNLLLCRSQGKLCCLRTCSWLESERTLALISQHPGRNPTLQSFNPPPIYTHYQQVPDAFLDSTSFSFQKMLYSKIVFTLRLKVGVPKLLDGKAKDGPQLDFITAF